MDSPYLGQICLVGFTFAPRGWALCNGQLLSISQHSALFRLLGTTYGGDGRSTFALPDLRNRTALGAGQGTGLSEYALGTQAGEATVTLKIDEVPAHAHVVTGTVRASGNAADTTNPAGGYWATQPDSQYGEDAGFDRMAANLVVGKTDVQGQDQAHDNLMPYLTLNYIIAIQGEYPR
ncbi:phage tail protein [Hymenobacter busanensis]|uniref:Phage tail protein n=1 Tax=Hymenobacter busanensis TaxID=2607656 RepID=A0A7L4ZT13_9BACT|nr:tail fiber protein [Hymenobacter busanensis]KAA9339761.1 phage tail protein [Hymenobacter busanensis]QHJ06484.1 phage tail protein [Hymenobacter busanensis]